ncbi:MAG: lipoprotein-releasing ABC transporter permease subunit [Pseudomonadota bacterium]
MAQKTAPFAPFEFMIAWRYLRAKRAEGGVSTMTWISLIGITLAVFALIATLSVRSGFRAELVDTILGANAHVTVYSFGTALENGGVDRSIADFDTLAEQIRAVPGVTRAAPLVRGEVLANSQNGNAGVQVYGIRADDLAGVPRVANPEEARGSLSDFPGGVAIGSGVARELGVTVGDEIKLISPNGAKTPFGVRPRVSSYPVAYVFTAGRFDIDRTRVYLPLGEAQAFFNFEDRATEIEVMVEDPEAIMSMLPALDVATGQQMQLWTWLDASGAFLRALEVEDNVMFIILSILVLIAAMNIVSGLIMLVKNKGRDIGILRTMGLTEGSILRVFFLCGAFTGVIGTLAGVILGCLFALFIDPIFSLVNAMGQGGVWDPAIRGLYSLPAELHMSDVMTAIGLSLGLSFIVTWFPARRAARMNPVEALRYE